MKAKFVVESLKEQEEVYDENFLVDETPFDEEDSDYSEDNDILVQDEFEAALNNELNVPEYSRREVSFRVKGKPNEIIDAIPMARMKNGSYLMKVGDTFKKFNINDIVEESFKNKKQSKLNEGSYDEFLMNYNSEIKDAIKNLRKIRDEIENGDISEEEFMSTFEKYRNIYDDEVIDWIERVVGGIGTVSPADIANLGIDIQDRYGTEMKMVLNAIEDISGSFGIHPGIPDDYE